MSSPGATEIPAIIEIAADRLTAKLLPHGDRIPKPADATAILAQVAARGIKLDQRGELEVQDFCRVRKAGQNVTPATIAHGTAPVNGTTAKLEAIAAPEQDHGAPRIVKAGDAVAVLTPPRPGQDGVDVLGVPIPHVMPEGSPKIDASLKPSGDGRTYTACIDGVLRIRGAVPNQAIAVVPCLRQMGDVTGKVMHSPGQIVIEGAVSGASLRAGYDILISGDMDSSMAMAEGDLSASSMRTVKLEVSGNCTALEVLQSRIVCGGELKVEDGNIVGGHVMAAGGIRCKSLGAPDFTKTIVEVGIDPRLSQRLSSIMPEIEARMVKARKIRQTVEPLLQSGQSLTPQQQLKIGALLAEADTLDTLAQSQRRELRQEYEAAMLRCRNEVHVHGTVFPGVTIRFPGVQTTARTVLRGPCRICLEKNDGGSRIVLISDGSNTVIPLELCRLDHDWRSFGPQLAA
jgi:uncharacterized protein (DUF342 family)